MKLEWRLVGLVAYCTIPILAAWFFALWEGRDALMAALR
jgi:hypothetical protein